jgi:methionyl-tRNA formyltransferase
MRIIFMGSPMFAVPTLDALVAAGHAVIAVYTQPPRPAGRGKADRPTAVELRARALGIEVRSPRSLRDAVEQAAFAALKADVAVVAAYGLILPQAILDAPLHGCLNVHGSLLPRWRGAAPVQRAIMAGDAVTGVTIMAMEAGLDTGPMLLKREFEIDGNNAAQVTGALAKIGAELMIEVLTSGDFRGEIQPDAGVTYAAKISKEEARIDWTWPAPRVARHVQGLAPFPGAWFEHGGDRIKLLAADAIDANGQAGEVLDDQLTIACGDRALRCRLLQRAGKAAMAVDDFLRGCPLPAGTMLR